jgi:hypothetical protein
LFGFVSTCRGYQPINDRTLLSNELLLAQILDQRFAATVLLIKALGGGWSPELASSRAETLASSAAGQ